MDTGENAHGRRSYKREGPLWDLTFLEIGLIMSILPVFLVSVLISFDPQNRLWLYFIGPIEETLKERAFRPLPLSVPRAPKKLNCFLILSPLILVHLLTKSHLPMLDNADNSDTSSNLLNNHCVQ